MPSKYTHPNISNKSWTYGASNIVTSYQISLALYEGSTSGSYTNVNLNQCILDVKLNAGMDDDLLHGLELAKVCTIKFDYDSMPAGLRTIIFNEESSGSVTINSVPIKIPNRLVLKYTTYVYEVGVGLQDTTRILFDGFQLKKNKSQYKYSGVNTELEVTFTSIEKFILDNVNFTLGLKYLYDNTILKITNTDIGTDSGEWVWQKYTKQINDHYTNAGNMCWHVNGTHLLEAMQYSLNEYYQNLLYTANDLVLGGILPEITFYKEDDEETSVTPHFIVAVGQTNSVFNTWKTNVIGGLLGDGSRSVSKNSFVKLGASETLKKIAETWGYAYIVTYDHTVEYDETEVPNLNLEFVKINGTSQIKPRLEGTTDGSQEHKTLTNLIHFRPGDLLFSARVSDNVFDGTYTIDTITWETGKFKITCVETNFNPDCYLIAYKIINKAELISFTINKSDDLTLIKGTYLNVKGRQSELNLGRGESEDSLEYELIFNNVPDKMPYDYADVNGIYEPRAGWNTAQTMLKKVSMNTTGTDTGGYSSNDSSVFEEEIEEKLNTLGIAVLTNTIYNNSYNDTYELEFEIPDGRFTIHNIGDVFNLDLGISNLPTQFKVTAVEYSLNGNCNVKGRSL